MAVCACFTAGPSTVSRHNQKFAIPRSDLLRLHSFYARHDFFAKSTLLCKFFLLNVFGLLDIVSLDC